MARVPFADITVANILEEAAISRANFYHYFSSKFDVLASLTAKILGEAYAEAGPWRATAGKDRARSLDQSLRETLDAWAAHGPVMHAAIEWMHEVPEVAQTWAAMREKFVAAIAEQIRHELPADAAPEVTATVLVCGLERSFYVSSRGLDPRIPDPAATVGPLVRITHDGIYGTSLPTAIELPTTHVVPDWFSVEDAASVPMDVAILNALNDLLLETPLQEVSVARILEKAGTSRASFYFYFASKDDAFLALYHRVAAGITQGFSTLLAQQETSSLGSLLGLVADWLTLDERTAAVFRNAVHEWPRQEVLSRAYGVDMTQMVDAFVAVLRANGAVDHLAPVDVEAFAATLLWTVERSIAGMLVGEEHLTDRDAVVGVLGRLMVSAFLPVG